DYGLIVWLKDTARMSISNLETVICKCSRKFQCIFARTHFSVCIRAESNARAQRKNQKEKPQPTFHLGDSLLSIAVISLPTASFSFRASSTLGALPSENETSFSLPVSCSLTSLTRGSLRNSGVIALSFGCMQSISYCSP